MNVVTIAAVAGLSFCMLTNASAKVFPLPHDGKYVLQDGDGFTVECRDSHTGVIDYEMLNVDEGTVTIVNQNGEGEPIVHRITSYGMDPRVYLDRFGQPVMQVSVIFADWAEHGGLGIGLIFNTERWISRHDDESVWICAN